MSKSKKLAIHAVMNRHNTMVAWYPFAAKLEALDAVRAANELESAIAAALRDGPFWCARTIVTIPDGSDVETAIGAAIDQGPPSDTIRGSRKKLKRPSPLASSMNLPHNNRSIGRAANCFDVDNVRPFSPESKEGEQRPAIHWMPLAMGHQSKMAQLDADIAQLS